MERMKMVQSIHKQIYQIFLDNPMHVYTTRDLLTIFNSVGERKTEKKTINLILIRLFRRKLVIRIPTQLVDGYYYTLQNNRLLNEIYKNHLLPYDFKNKKELIDNINKMKFENLDSNNVFDVIKLNQFDFCKKYPDDLTASGRVKEFLALLVGFIMCDGNINKTGTQVEFFFRRETDAKLFVNDFKSIFWLEKFRIKKSSNGNSYVVVIRKGSLFAKLMCCLGVPKGNKVFQPFLIPNWIFHGSNGVKKTFLSTVIGNEGSAPSNHKWRIQFVLSKSKEHVPNLIEFLNQIRAMLYHFDIETSHIQLRKQKGRQFHGRFYIKSKENLHKFYKNFSFLYASEKQEILEQLILSEQSLGMECVMIK
jgi:hypothetical protein